MVYKKKKIIVVGGGFAGLTAARRLLKENYEVEIVEKRTVFGGKWSAWKDASGDWIETGLHVFFGAYEEIFDLMKELNIYDRIHWKEHVLTYTLDAGERFEFRTINLPSPFHLLPAVFKNHYFNWMEKLSLAKALGPILFGSRRYYDEQDKITYQEWHRKHGIADKMLSKMFLPMTLALKFLAPKDIAAKIVLDVSGTFLRKNSASRIGFLKGSPDQHFTVPLLQDIVNRGGQVANKHKLLKVNLNSDDSIASLLFEVPDGKQITKTADHYLFALPIHNLQKVMPESWLKYSYFQGLKQIKSVPVITLHLWTDRAITDINNIIFSPDGNIPVYADMSLTTPDYHLKGQSRFQFVVAPADELIGLPDDEIVSHVWRGLQGIFPETTPKAQITKSVVVKVPRSVYWPAPGTDKFRVPQKTPVANLTLAGGYTKQRFYDSMEGAVRSGNRAADVIIAAHRIE